MLLSQLLGERYREQPAEATLKSHCYLLRGGYIRQAANGIYSLLPPAQRISRNLQALIREELDALGGQEVLFPVVLPGGLWKESGRFDAVGGELVRFRDRTGRDMVLGMTHEEAAVQLARSEAKSHAQYPFLIYQLQTKFRDELRPRGGLLRTREFTMQDAYSFHTGWEDLEGFYSRMLDAYARIFSRAGLSGVYPVRADSGMMGGQTAHEFLFLSPDGEDTLYSCPRCGCRANAETLPGADETEVPCPDCGAQMEAERGIEVGHIFQLGDKYTRSMNMTYTGKDGAPHFPVMGCYGIGIGRLMACVLEANCDSRGPVWPKAVAPWQVHLCCLPGGGEAPRQAALGLYEALSRRFSVLLDDRSAPAGVQFSDADLLGAPIRLVLSRRTLETGSVELSARDGSFQKLLPLDAAPGFLSSYFLED